MASIVNARQVVTKVRSAAKNKRVRVNEFFKDFDRLRRGYVTRDQFLRCLNQHFGIRLDSNEFAALVAEFDMKGDGTVNYRRFSDAVDIGFDPNLLDDKPDAQLSSQSADISGSNLSEEEWHVTEEILARCHQFCKYRGISVKDCYEDFDYHHVGLVTRDQFLRSFPGPIGLGESALLLLAKRYEDPGTKLYNFVKFHKDVATKDDASSANREMSRHSQSQSKSGRRTGDDVDFDLTSLLDELKVIVYKHGIRTTEFFQDHDKLRSGLVTENQFACGLALCFRGKTSTLSRDRVQTLVDAYGTGDGRVRYRDFCRVMENAFNEADLEKRPTQVVVRPLKGTLAWGPNRLSPVEEARLDDVLAYVGDTVKKRRLLLYPFFKDFDRGKGYTRGVTKTQFARILDSNQLNVPQEDVKLICRKFEHRNSGDVNYSAFIQAIDSEYTGQVIESTYEPSVTPPLRDGSAQEANDESDVEKLLDKIRYHVKVNRIRATEFFRDFDLLRTGSITENHFRQSLDTMGFRGMSSRDFDSLASRYRSTKIRRGVLWKKFVDDVDSVFTEANLEATPTRVVAPLDSFVVPKAGAFDWDLASDEDKALVDGAIFWIKERLAQRRILAKPCFQDFDRHNNGYVTSKQFRQCMSFLCLSTSDEEMLAILKKYSDDVGVNYIDFLKDVEPTVKEEPKYPKYVETLKSLQLSKSKSASSDPLVDVEQVMTKIKTKVTRERIRVLEFMRDYDSLKTGRMLKTTFPRALDLCAFGLKPAEVNALIEKYEYSKDKDYVEYLKFSDDVEAVFTTKDLEKAPTLAVHPFVPPHEVDQNALTPQEEATLDLTVHRLAERVRVRNIQITPLFADYDRVHMGSVSRSQFRRVLGELELGSLVSEHEFTVLYKRFDVRVGGKDDVNYIAFCAMVSEYAQFVWREK